VNLNSEASALDSFRESDLSGRISFMRGCKWTGHAIFPSITGGVLLLFLACFAWAGDGPSRIDRTPVQGDSDVSIKTSGNSQRGVDLVFLIERSRQSGRWLIAWYVRTPPPDRVIWGGLTACAGLALCVLLERVFRLRPRRIVPADFTACFLDRLYEGKLDCGEALDHCERNPSPAARVALAAVRRWGRPSADLERAVALAHKVETERLRRNVGTLRRVAALATLLGLLGVLFAAGRALEAIPPTPIDGGIRSVEPVAWGPALAAALSPLSAGIIIATLVLVAYDGLLTRIEKLAGALDRLGAETIDAIALAAPISTPTITLAKAPSRTPHQSLIRHDEGIDAMPRSRQSRSGS
jgi:biopolymer transport protein ExbB